MAHDCCYVLRGGLGVRFALERDRILHSYYFILVMMRNDMMYYNKPNLRLLKKNSRIFQA